MIQLHKLHLLGKNMGRVLKLLCELLLGIHNELLGLHLFTRTWSCELSFFYFFIALTCPSFLGFNMGVINLMNMTIWHYIPIILRTISDSYLYWYENLPCPFHNYMIQKASPVSVRKNILVGQFALMKDIRGQDNLFSPF